MAGQSPAIPAASEAGSVSVDPRAAELLSRTIIGQLGLIGLDGYPRVLPVWFEYRDGEVLIASQPNTYKGRALARNGNASLAVSTVERPYQSATDGGYDAGGRPAEPEWAEGVAAS